MKKRSDGLLPTIPDQPERIHEEKIQRLLEIISMGKTVKMACGVVGIIERKLYAQMRWDQDLHDRVEIAKGAGLSILHDTFAEAAAKDAKAQLTYMRIFDPVSMNPDPRNSSEVHIRVEEVKKALPSERIDAEGRVIDVSFDVEGEDDDF